jgi:DNA-directed RNA polymerase subunit beta'
VGVIAAQSIGEPGTQLTMRTFHIGGAASRLAEQSNLEGKTTGSVRFHNLITVKNKNGHLIVMNRNGEIAITDTNGREREKYPLVYGATLFVKEGDTVEKGKMLAEWDPYSTPIITEASGRIAFEDIEEGVTMQEQFDSVTGLSHKVVIESRAIDKRPKIKVVDTNGVPVHLTTSRRDASYLLPLGANLVVADGDEVFSGDVIGKIHRETTKTKDITGGLPRVAELFEARKPKDASVITEIDGVISFGKDTKGKRKIVVTPEVGEAKEYLVAKGRHLAVNEGDFVRAGEALTDGPVNPHDILKVLGEKALAKYLVDEVQEVYRLQGVKINDKHIEVIVRNMLRKVKIKEIGDANFLGGESVEKAEFELENQRLIQAGLVPAVAEPLLLGITKASLSTESFISAASFQETTKVLTEAAINGRVDYLRGLKENVIMGRLIPAGTGLLKYSNMRVKFADKEVVAGVAPTPSVEAPAPEMVR